MSKKKTALRCSIVASLATSIGDRNFVVAKVEDWLSKKSGLKLIQAVKKSDISTKISINDKTEQVKIIFNQTFIDIDDPRRCLGLVLDKELGWNICEMTKYGSSYVVSKVIRTLGFYSYPKSLENIFFKNISASDSSDASIIITRLFITLYKVTAQDDMFQEWAA